MSKAAENANIDIFLRVKPVPRPSDKLFIDNNENKLEFVIPRSLAQGFVNNQREHYEFRCRPMTNVHELWCTRYITFA
jgi:kinesin family protein 6/9